MRRTSLALSIVLACAGFAACANAQVPTTQTRNPHNTYGSPLDTLKSSHLWTDVAPAEGFVRESRPDPATLDYQPLTGTDPDRAKPRDKANVAALQAELEHDRVANNRKSPGAAKAARQAAAPHRGKPKSVD